jgi:AraC-like DNA-binding protein
MDSLLKTFLIAEEYQSHDLSDFVGAVEQLFQQHQGEGMHIKQLSSILCTSERNLRRRCNKLFGIAPSELISRIKIEKAKALLSQGLLVADVAHVLGFSSPSHFSKVFKESCGVSPSGFDKSNFSE